MGTFALSNVFLNLETQRRLVSASAVGDISTVRKLLRKKVNVNVRDEMGNTALSSAGKGQQDGWGENTGQESLADRGLSVVLFVFVVVCFDVLI